MQPDQPTSSLPVGSGSAAEDALVARIADAVEARLRGTLAASAATPSTTPLQASGLYQCKYTLPLSLPWGLGSAEASEALAGPEASAASEEQAFGFSWPRLPSVLPLRREELRLDVDGQYPQNVVSGTQSSGLTQVVHWIANLQPNGANRWRGQIWYRDGSTTAFRYTDVDVRAVPGQSAQVTFSGGGMPNRTSSYTYVGPYFHPIEFEFDAAAGAAAVTSINTGDHPTRPPAIPHEALSLEAVYRRAGFDVAKSGRDDVVPLNLAGADVRWSNQEMHDAMQVYWSRFAPKAQWSVWVFFAALHDMGTGLGGIMFDDIGPNQRQGTAIFGSSFIAEAPTGDPNPAAWVSRMRFWTAAHEMGHSFNLAHSWQKSLGTPWIPLADEPSAFTFMNYPYRVPPGPENVFFQNFEYRFSDSELLFMRHAPFRYVQHGNALWFDQHGFQSANVQDASAFRLVARVNRPRAEFEFLEPMVIELKLSNASAEPRLIPENLLLNNERMTVIVKKDGGHARHYLPFARLCLEERRIVLAPGQSVYESLFVGAGRNGWDLAEPGNYTIQVAVHLDDEDVVSSPLRVRVTPPRSFEEQHLAQDFFSDQVGRVLAFDGSAVLDAATSTLREVAERLPDRRVAVHARIALGNSVAGARKRIEAGGGLEPARPLSDVNARVVETPSDAAEARKQLAPVLQSESALSAETLGHIDYHEYVDKFAEWLVTEGDTRAAAAAMEAMYTTLAKRGVRKPVLDAIAAQRDRYIERTGRAQPDQGKERTGRAQRDQGKERTGRAQPDQGKERTGRARKR